MDTSWVSKENSNERVFSVIEAELDSDDEVPGKISQNRPTRQHRTPDHWRIQGWGGGGGGGGGVRTPPPPPPPPLKNNVKGFNPKYKIIS